MWETLVLGQQNLCFLEFNRSTHFGSSHSHIMLVIHGDPTKNPSCIPIWWNHVLNPDIPWYSLVFLGISWYFLLNPPATPVPNRSHGRSFDKFSVPHSLVAVTGGWCRQASWAIRDSPGELLTSRSWPRKMRFHHQRWTFHHEKCGLNEET